MPDEKKRQKNKKDKRERERVIVKKSQGGSFLYELDDLILGRLITLEEMANLTPNKYQEVCDKIETTLRSPKVLDILRGKVQGIIDRFPNISEFFAALDGGSSYFEGPDTLISRLLGRDRAAQLSSTQTRILTARVKEELLDSDEIINSLRDEVRSIL